MKLLSFLLTACAWIVIPNPAYAQNQPPINDNYQVGTVQTINNIESILVDSQTYYIQELDVINNQTNQVETITIGSNFQPLTKSQLLTEGDNVVLSQQEVFESEPQTIITDVYRIPVLTTLAGLFCLLVIMVSGKRGLLSITGMLLSLAILVLWIIPKILAGNNPFTTTLLGATLTAGLTMYLSHGFSRKVHIALVSMLACLIAVASLSLTAVKIGHFVGLGSEEAAFLQFDAAATINLQGLFLAGVLLGAIGILDDITIAQASLIQQLKAVNKNISFSELYWRGLEVGKDHVASLVNTLVFAYAGTSLPLFLLFTLYRASPIWTIINSELIAEEIMRTLAGSIGLVLAVPLTTLIASYIETKYPKPIKPLKTHHHHH